jgi:hypothetical protein
MGDEALRRKLGVRPGQRVCVLGAPEGYAERLGTPDEVWSALRFRPAAEVGT